MSVTASRVTTITYSGDISGTEQINATDNEDSPGQMEIKTLALGANTITVPGGGSTPVACTIVKPSANATAITLKGVTGDTGIALHLTDPDTISLQGVTSFVLTAAAEIVGVRLLWT